MDEDKLAEMLTAGVKECRATPYNMQINRLGDVLLAMLKTIRPDTNWRGDASPTGATNSQPPGSLLP